MLRLRPSELTLTPEDIDEAFRRIAVRQSSRDSRHAPSQALAQPGRPILRRGPQRAVRDAITTLGDIPILRPQPQQAISSSMDDDIEVDHEPQTPSPRQRIDSASTSPVRDEQLALVNADAAATSPLRLLHLPFRLGRGRRESRIQSLPADNQVERATMPPTRRTPEDLDGAAHRNDSGQRTPSTPPATPPTAAELRGGGGRPESKARRDSSRDLAAASSSRQVNRSSSHNTSGLSSADPTTASTAGEDEPTLHLRGFFTDPAKYPRGPHYWFEEVRGVVPQTEPRRASGRPAIPARSLSSGSAPTFSLLAAGHRSFSADEEAFPMTATRTSSRPRDRQLSLYPDAPRLPLVAQRNFSSEASAASDAFSFYQLSESRQSSGERPGTTNPSLAQFDGSAASRYRQSGTYHSVRPSELRAISNPRQGTLLDLDIGGQHGISPLPSSPYTRTQSHDNTPQSFPVFASQDAATAAVQGLASPLEPFSEHYQRLVELQNARLMLSAQQSPYPYRSTYSSDTHYGAAGEFAARRLSDRLPQPLSSSRPSQATGILSGDPDRASRASVRGTHATRTSQRSSENAPVRTPAQSSAPSRNSQVQIHRAAFERLHNAMQDLNAGTPDVSRQDRSRRSLPPTVPRDTSNRPRASGVHPPPPPASRNTMRHRTQHTSSSPAHPSPSEQPSDSLPSPTAPGEASIGPPTIPPWYNSNMRGGGPHDRSTARARRRVTPIVRSSAQLRAIDQTGTTTSIRSPLLRAATTVRPTRRVPPQQRDQENSGQGEEQLMRQEEAAINARYGEEGQGDTMDETPPRVGRVERRMFS
ncbi:hypothetical protein BDU57DRAFT_523131 [Ampelomyces quisqualis]|uniref:Uncharacterized protein n=1 Tax=Ampelomyces quisqualis TaxID=50730 RepID=A0A6A5QBI2_AMPQU|nr:hypothetical protein BDU57DRAFT_523131 [Ampelomyces quisqualis]